MQKITLALLFSSAMGFKLDWKNPGVRFVS